MRDSLAYRASYSFGAAAEIAKFELPLRIQQYVLHLDIAVRDALPVHVLKHAADDQQYLYYGFFAHLLALVFLQEGEGRAAWRMGYPELHFSMKRSPYFSSLLPISQAS